MAVESRNNKTVLAAVEQRSSGRGTCCPLRAGSMTNLTSPTQRTGNEYACNMVNAGQICFDSEFLLFHTYLFQYRLQARVWEWKRVDEGRERAGTGRGWAALVKAGEYQSVDYFYR
jgi:hypothetical protein